MKAKLMRESLQELNEDNELDLYVLLKIRAHSLGRRPNISALAVGSETEMNIKLREIKNKIAQRTHSVSYYLSIVKVKESLKESLNEDHKNNFEDYKQEITYHLEDEDNHDLSWQNVEDLMLDKEIEKELLDLYNDKVPPFKAANIIIDNYY